MSAYGDITCDFCGAVYHEQEPHQCNAVAVANEITRLLQRVAELEAKAELWEDMNSESADYWYGKAKERGERMKEMRDILEKADSPKLVWLLVENKPFDPETGEPL